MVQQSLFIEARMLSNLGMLIVVLLLAAPPPPACAPRQLAVVRRERRLSCRHLLTLG